jgi:hypothetical protein
MAAQAVSLTPLVPPQRIQLCKLGSKSHRTSGVNVPAGAVSAVSVETLVPLLATAFYNTKFWHPGVNIIQYIESGLP